MDKDGLQKCLLLIECNVRREYVTGIRLKDMIKEIILKHHYILGQKYNNRIIKAYSKLKFKFIELHNRVQH